MPNTVRINGIRDEYSRLYTDASYGAQVHWESAKAAELLGRGVVFLAAVVSGLGALLVALDYPKSLGALGAVAGAVAATATLLGPERKAPAHKESARRYTGLRHLTELERSLLNDGSDLDRAEHRLRELRAEYNEILGRDEATPNWVFKRVDKRISSGVLSYDDSSPRPDHQKSSPIQ